MPWTWTHQLLPAMGNFPAIGKVENHLAIGNYRNMVNVGCHPVLTEFIIPSLV